MSKKFNSVVDILNNLEYIENTNIDSSYEQEIVEIMMYTNCTLAEAIDADLYGNGVDTQSVIDIVDYMESKLKDLNKVNLLMGIYTGRYPDMRLSKL